MRDARRRRQPPVLGVGAFCSLICLGGLAQAQSAPSDPLNDLSLEELTNVQVTSVSRRAQPVGEAPAAVYVITADDILRAGVRSIPAALRLAPNLHVARIDAASYAISARGFNHSSGTANKLLVLSDGRIVYTPLFSGVFWDEQNAIMEDLDRIEVVSGPGGTLWGANAVNGVINIVSRDAHETTGLFATGGFSDASAALGLRYGARIGESGAFRVYGLGLRRAAGEPTQWDGRQVGFRSDWSYARDAVTFQGDLYAGDREDMPGQLQATENRGGNVLGRWTHRFDGDSALEAQAYYDRTSRQVASGIRAEVDAFAFDTQYNFALGSRHSAVIGGGARITSDTFTPGPGTARLVPDERTLRTYHGFAQDTVSLSSDVDLIVGLKLEHNSYTGLEYMPSARLAWRPSANSLVWGAGSRAVRTPARFDRDLYSFVLAGGPDFISEELTAYELGYRAQPNERFWFSASAYYNVYDQLRTLEASGPAVFPLVIRNGMRGDTYGLEMWGGYALTDWWRITGGMAYLEKNLEIDPGSADITGVDFAGNDPELQGTLRSLMDIGERAEFDLSARAVGELPSPRVPAYLSVDARFGFRLTERLEISVAGYNLLDDTHVEFVNPSFPPRTASRSYFISARWRQ